ncbi:MAG: hypothetical protein AB7O60_15255 [Variibacter sp.]
MKVRLRDTGATGVGKFPFRDGILEVRECEAKWMAENPDVVVEVIRVEAPVNDPGKGNTCLIGQRVLGER